MWSHNEVAEKTNLLASYVGTKAVNKGNGADLTVADFSSCKTFRKIAALYQR
jgi:hypothetical protein